MEEQTSQQFKVDEVIEAIIKRELQAQRSKLFVVSVMGQKGVGKTSLINALFNTKLEVDPVRPTTKEIEQVTVSAATGQKLIFYDMPGIGDLVQTKTADLSVYQKYLLTSDVVLWVIHVDSHLATFDRQALEYILDDLKPSQQNELVNRITFVLTKADIFAPSPWLIAYHRKDNSATFVPSRETKRLLEQKALYFQSQLLQPFADHLVSRTYNTKNFTLNESRFSYDKYFVRFHGLLTQELVDKFSGDHPEYKGVFESLYNNHLPIPCSAHYRYNLNLLALTILNKLESTSARNFQAVINLNSLDNISIHSAMRMNNLFIYDVENDDTIFDLADDNLPNKIGIFFQEIRRKDIVKDEEKQQKSFTEKQQDNDKNNTLIYGPVQGLILGEHNTVTLVFQNDERHIVPFLAPPQPLYGLLGRKELIDHLKQQLFHSQNLALSALNGLPGVGKTALALVLAHDKEVLENFPDGVLWAGLGRESNTFWHLKTWGMALGVSPSEMERLTSISKLAQIVQSAIGTRKMLLVVDDAWSVEAALAFKLGGPHCAHLVTTRFPEIAEMFAGDRTIIVKELHEDAGLTLLERLAPGLIRMAPGQARELVNVVGGLPLPLTLMGNYLRIQMHTGQPRRIRAALDRLQQVKERLQLSQSQAALERHPSLAEGIPLSLLEIIKISDEALTEEARQAFRALSVFPSKPNTFAEEAALYVGATSTTAIDMLTDFGLLESSGPSRYTLHQSISDYAAIELTDTNVHERMVEYFIKYVDSHKAEHSLLERETSNILASVQIVFEKDLHPSGVIAFAHFIRILRRTRAI